MHGDGDFFAEWGRGGSERRVYLKNAYRVLLTRARQGMAIYVPSGSDDDQTRKCKWYDGIYECLKEIGILGVSYMALVK